MKILIGFLILFSASDVLACMNDMQCGLGKVCVKPEGSIRMDGVCATPTDENGMPSMQIRAPEVQPRQVSSCSFDTDCSLGESCVKRSGELRGICVK